MEDESRRVKVASVFSSMHTAVVTSSDRMLVELKRYNYVTPTNFLELVKVIQDNHVVCTSSSLTRQTCAHNVLVISPSKILQTMPW